MTVHTDLDDHGVLVITLDRPERKNAFDGDQWDAAAAALDDARADGRVAAVVVTGAGGDFSAGVDLSAFGEQKVRDDGHDSDYEAFMHSLIPFDKPLLAAVDGAAIGIGATLPLHCDVVHVGEALRMRFPFVSLGLVPEGAASVLLERVAGQRTAGEILLTAEWIDADRAVSYGLATDSFASDALLDATIARARDIRARDGRDEGPRHVAREHRGRHRVHGETGPGLHTVPDMTRSAGRAAQRTWVCND